MIKTLIKKVRNNLLEDNFDTLNRIEISKNAIINNFNVFQEINPGFSVIPVLKSNAYGHGIIQCAKILNSVKCDFLAVDGYYEAAKIIDITDHRILVMGYIKSANFNLLNLKKYSFVVQDVDSLNSLARLNKKVNIHVELNTGMNRLGLTNCELNDYLAVLKKSPKLNLEGVMTHLADADNNNDDFTKNQVEKFDKMYEMILNSGFSPKFAHIAQTAGCLTAKSKYANAVRVGIGIYGLNPLGDDNKSFARLAKLKPAMKIKSTIIKTIELGVGDKISYNGIFVADRPMKIGVLPIGYYEAVSRELSNRGYITTCSGGELPIVGRVCMSHTMIDLVGLDLKVGDEVVVISDESSQINSVARICKENDLFNYQLVARITENIRRTIVY